MALENSNNPESPVAHSSPVNKSGEKNQIRGLNISFGGSIEFVNKLANEDGENNRTTSSQNENAEGEYCQNQELNITFTNVSFNSDSGNEQKSIVEQMVKTIAGSQTQLIKINYAPLKIENKESQTESNEIDRFYETFDYEEFHNVKIENLENSDQGEKKLIGSIKKCIKTLTNLFAFSKFQKLYRKVTEAFKQPTTQDETIKIELLKND